MKDAESFKLKTETLNAIRQLKEKDSRTITWHIEKALSNYLKSKKVR